MPRHFVERAGALQRRALLLVALFPAVAGAQTTAAADRWSMVRDSIRVIMQRLHAPSVSVAVAEHGHIVWEEGFGWADVDQRIPATPNTLYSMASISKPMTATALMTLAQRGAVDLGRPANDYLGASKITGLAGSASEATVMRVMSHTAGLPLHYRFFYEGGATPGPNMDEAIARYGIVSLPAGQVYSYSNLGYGILEQIVAKQSKGSFEAYIHDAVFAPLGMPRTALGTGRGLERAAVRYDDSLKAIPYYDFDHRGASAVWTTAHELARFGMFHLRDHLPDQRPILSDSVLLDMQQVRTPGDTAHGYGLGWIIDDDHGFRRVAHTGGMPGVSTVLSLYPAQDLVVVALGNQSNPLPSRAAQEITAAILPGYRARLTDDRARQQAGDQDPARQDFSAPANLQGDWTGTVRTYQGAVPIALRVKDDEVLVRLGGSRALWTLLNRPAFRSGLLQGQFVGTIPTDDARRYPHTLSIAWLLAEDKLRGWIAAVATDIPVSGAVSSYAELTRP